MPTVHCPSCRDEVTAPDNTPGDAVVRCPLCSDEFELSVVLDSVPPSLIIVSGGGAVAATVDENDDRPAFEFSEQAAPSAQVVKTSSSSAPSSSRTSRRPRRKQANPIWEVVKVGGGGIIGLSIGQVILWWAFHRDPVKLAPKIPTAMQWILPSALRTGAAADDLPEEEGASNVGSFPLGSTGEFPASGDTAGGTARQQRPPEPLRATPPRNAAQGKAAPGGQPSRPRVGRNGQNSANSAKNQAQATIARPPIVSVRNSPTFSPDKLSAAIDDAESALDAWRDAKGSGRNTTAASKKLYTDFAQLAHTVTFVDPQVALNRQLADKAKRIAESLPEDALNMFGAATDSWIRKRTNDGVALFGLVTSIQKQGQLFETIVKLNDSNQRRVSIISGADPEQEIQVGDRVLVLGEIIEDPTQRVEGYDGLAPMVILGGLPVKFSAPRNTAKLPAVKKPKKSDTAKPGTTGKAETEARTPSPPEPENPSPPVADPSPPEEKPGPPETEKPEPSPPEAEKPEAETPEAEKPEAETPRPSAPKPPESDS